MTGATVTTILVWGTAELWLWLVQGMTIIISKYLYSSKFTNKCAQMRCLIKYMVIHCVQHIYIYEHTHMHTHVYIHTIYTMIVVNIIKHITVIWLALRWYMILNIRNYPIEMVFVML